MRHKKALYPSDEETKPFREIRASELDAHTLKQQMSAYGYVLIRNLLFPRDAHPLLREITQLASRAGFLQSNRDPLDRLVNPDRAATPSNPSLKRLHDQVFNLEAFHALPHHPSLRQVMEFIVGPHLLVHPKPVPRLVFPNAHNFQFNAHQDYAAYGGDPQTYTAWIPLHDCPAKLGPLQILEASHRFGVQKTEPDSTFIPWKAAQGGPWVGGRIDAGDVLVFHSLTVHAASPNTSSQLRICLDCRFQSFDHPINPANLVFSGPNGKSWESTYANWRSDLHKYYWKALPLQLQPSIAELTACAESAQSPEARERYARILSQLPTPADAAAAPSR